MKQLHRWLYTLCALLCCAMVVPRLAFAEEKTLEAARERITVLETEIAQVEAVIARADAQIAAAQQVLNAHAAHQASAVLIAVATFTAHAPAEGWNAWRRQSRAYKQSHPWEKIFADNCVRDPRICKRTAPTGTVFYLPAPEIYVYVHEGLPAPEAIMLAPTADPRLFTLDPTLPVMIHGEVAAKQALDVSEHTLASYRLATFFLAVSAGLALLLFGIASARYRQSERLRRECDMKIKDLGHRLSLYRT